jgi:hypothetical protein
MPRVINLANFQQYAAINVLTDPGNKPGPVVIPQCAQITLKWAMDGGVYAHNVLYGRYPGGFVGGVGQANTIFTALSTSAQFISLKARMPIETSFAGVSIRDVNTRDQPIIDSALSQVGGTNATPALPNEVALCITLRTGLTGRANRGRMFIPNFATDCVQSGNTATSITISNLQGWADTILGALAASSYTMVIGQKARVAYTGSTGTEHPARDATSTQVLSLLVRDNHFDSQRRRGMK